MKHTLKQFTRVTKMINTDHIYKEVEHTIKNVELIKNCLSQIEQEFTDTNYPNWIFDVVLNDRFSENPGCHVNGISIERGLNCHATIEIQFICGKQKTIVNLNYAYLSFNCVDIEYLKTMEQILNMPNVPFELTRVICKILAETKYENLVTKGIKELKIALKKLDLNKDFENA